MAFDHDTVIIIMEDIKEKLENKGFVVSRLASWAKEYIKDRAKAEFADDFGACIVYLIQQTNEYEMIKGRFLQGELPIKIGLDKTDIQPEIGKILPTNGIPTKFGGKKNE
jgi:hypothetical protein